MDKNKISIFETSAYLCKPNCVFVNAEGKPLYHNGSHLTLTGKKS